MRSMDQEMKPDVKKEDDKIDPVTLGDYCIGRNSAGGTCGHRARDHGDIGGGCARPGCGCTGFEPNA